MKRILTNPRLHRAFYTALIVVNLCLHPRNGGAQQAPQIGWQAVNEHVHIARNIAYRTRDGSQIKFTAVRFHLGYTRLRLLDTQRIIDAGRDVKDGIARVVLEGKVRAQILSYSLEGLVASLNQNSTSFLVMTPAGWSRSQRFVEHVGLLRIDGRTIHDLSDRGSLSAVFCLHDAERYHDYDAFVPVLFYVGDDETLSPRATRCANAVQAGPRIIEESGKAGITVAELSRPKAQRVVFAVDDPKRTAPPKSRAAARNGYLLVTHNEVNLYNLQALLLDNTFYSGGGPHWAVNLAGSNLTGMALGTGEKPELVENTLAVVGSALVVERRP